MSLGVGVIGVNAEHGWAKEGHVAAVQAISGLELVAVGGRSQDRAEAAARAVGAPKAYGDAEQLVNDPDIDVVSVAAPVPAHRDLIATALSAGKHVLTEWPVTPGTTGTEELAAQASRTKVHTAVGLQARMSPAAARAVEVIRRDGVGRVLSVTVYSSTAGFGGEVSSHALYLEDPATGMNLPQIQMAHTLDFVVALLGPLTTLAALTTIQYPQLKVTDSADPFTRTIPDHVAVHGRLSGGAALMAQIVGGRPPEDTPFRVDVVGAEASLTISGGGPRGFQASRLTLTVDGAAVDVDAGELASLPDSVVNIAGLYAALRNDIRDDTTTAPSFDHAVRLSHLVDDVLGVGADALVTPTAPWPA